MARKRKKSNNSYVALAGPEWLASWMVRFSYTPPPAVKRGQFIRKVEGILCDPTLFTPIGPSKQVVKRRHSRSL